MSRYDDRPYEVGKGKPPREHRWKPGQSGNPRGPRRRAKASDATMDELLAEIVNEGVEVKIAGRTIRMPKKKAILLSLVHDAANGTPVQRLKVFNALARVGAFDLKPTNRQPTAEEQEQVILSVMERLAEEATRDGYA